MARYLDEHRKRTKACFSTLMLIAGCRFHRWILADFHLVCLSYKHFYRHCRRGKSLLGERIS